MNQWCWKKKLSYLLVAVIFLGLHVGAFAQESEETSLYDRGNTLIVQGKWKDAADTFGELLERFPRTGYTDSRFWLGFSLVEMEKYQQGIRHLEEFARLYPNSGYAPQALYKVGEVYEKRLRDYDRALSAYDRIVNRYPGDDTALPAMQNQAQIYTQRKMDYDRAVEKFEKSKSLAAKQGIPQSSDYVRKADQRIRFIRDNSDYDYKPLKIFMMGMNHEEKNRWNEAEGVYRVLLSQFPDAKIADDTRFRIINCLLKQDMKTHALSAAREFLQLHPRSPYADRVKSILLRIDKDQGDFFKGFIYTV